MSSTLSTPCLEVPLRYMYMCVCTTVPYRTVTYCNSDLHCTALHDTLRYASVKNPKLALEKLKLLLTCKVWRLWCVVVGLITRADVGPGVISELPRGGVGG